MTEYLFPEWWDWYSNPADEIPPGILAILCIRPAFGGGTAVVGGSMQGNTEIHTAQQAQAAARQHGASQVTAQLNKQQSDIVQREVNRHGQRR